MILKRKKTKIKIGNIVKFKSWDEMQDEFGLTLSGHIDCQFVFSRYMKDLCGQCFQVNSVGKRDGNLILETVGKTYWISEDMVRRCSKFDERI